MNTKQTIRHFSLVALVVTLFSFFAIGCAPKNGREPSMKYLFHTVAYPGETLSAITKWYTGTIANLNAVVDANPGINPRRIKVGSEIRIPYELTTRSDAPRRSFFEKKSPREMRNEFTQSPPESVPSEASSQDSTPQPSGESPVADIQTTETTPESPSESRVESREEPSMVEPVPETPSIENASSEGDAPPAKEEDASPIQEGTAPFAVGNAPSTGDLVPDPRTKSLTEEMLDGK